MAEGSVLPSPQDGKFRHLRLSLPACPEREFPPSVPLIIPSTYEYDAINNTVELKEGASSRSQLKIVEESGALDLLKTITKPLAVLAMCGPYRTGKSYFLSQMLDIPCFKSSTKAHACTKGIWMGTTALECDDFVLVLLDTEGMNAVGDDNDTAHMGHLIVMTTLLSSCFIYNSSDLPNRDDLEQMSSIAQCSTCIIGGRSGCQTHFPDFVWMLRDIDDDTLVDDCDNPITPREYITTNVLAGNDDSNVASAILTLFPSVDGQTLPLPAEDPPHDDEAFRNKMKEVKMHLFNNIKAKKGCDGRIVDGPTLAILVGQYTNALNEPIDRVNVQQHLSEARIEVLHRTLVNQYKEEMEKAVESAFPLAEGNLNDAIAPMKEIIIAQMLRQLEGSENKRKKQEQPTSEGSGVQQRGQPTSEGSDVQQHGQPSSEGSEVQQQGQPTSEGSDVQQQGQPTSEGSDVQQQGQPTSEGSEVQQQGQPTSEGSEVQQQGQPTSEGSDVQQQGQPTSEGSDVQQQGQPTSEGSEVQQQGQPTSEGSDVQQQGQPTSEGSDVQQQGQPTSEGSDVQQQGQPTLEGSDVQQLGQPTSVTREAAEQNTEAPEKSQISLCDLPLPVIEIGITVPHTTPPVGTLSDTPVNAIAAATEESEEQPLPPSTITFKHNALVGVEVLPSIFIPVKVCASITVPIIVPPPPPLPRNADNTPKILMSIHRKILTQKLEVLQRELDFLMPVSSVTTKAKKREATDMFMQEIVKCRFREDSGVEKVNGGILKQFVKTNRKESKQVCEKLFKKAFQPLKDNFNDRNMLIGNINYRFGAVGPAEPHVFLKKIRELAKYTSSLHPSKPENLRVVGKESSWIKIRWDEPLTHPLAAKRYCVLKQKEKDIAWSVVFEMTRKSSALITNLERNTKYTFHVRAVNGNHEFGDIADIMVKTNRVTVFSSEKCSQSDSDPDSDDSSGSYSDGDFYD